MRFVDKNEYNQRAFFFSVSPTREITTKVTSWIPK